MCTASAPTDRRLAVLASGAARRDRMVELCRRGLPAAGIEPVRDLVELVIRIASLDIDTVVIDGGWPGCLPEEGATVLKGLCPRLRVAILDPEAGDPVPRGIDAVLTVDQLGAWLAHGASGGRRADNRYEARA